MGDSGLTCPQSKVTFPGQTKPIILPAYMALQNDDLLQITEVSEEREALPGQTNKAGHQHLQRRERHVCRKKVKCVRICSDLKSGHGDGRVK